MTLLMHPLLYGFVCHDLVDKVISVCGGYVVLQFIKIDTILCCRCGGHGNVVNTSQFVCS